ncbi:MAG: hypothetical protein J7L95_07595 [Prolixibacteraceae bacterium]|nr:hypothetical protein [Prolixibacteraceae bacterium]
MKTTLGRILFLTLFSLGIALTFLPFNENQSGEIEKEQVVLQCEPFLLPNDLPELSTVSNLDITGQELNPDDFPGLWSAFLNIDADITSDSANWNEWEKFQSGFYAEIKPERIVVFREKLIRCWSDSVQNKDSKKVILTFLGNYNPVAPELTEVDFSNFPKIKLCVDSMINDKQKSDCQLDKTVWEKFVKQKLTQPENEGSFYFRKFYFTGYYDSEFQLLSGKIEHLKITLKMLGVLLLLFGLFQLKKLRSEKNVYWDILRKYYLLYDGIALLFFIPSAWLLLNWILDLSLHVKPIVADPFLLITGSFFFLVGIILIPLVTEGYLQKNI